MKYIIASNCGNWDSSSLGAVAVVEDDGDLFRYVTSKEGPEVDKRVYHDEYLNDLLDHLETDCLVKGDLVEIITTNDHANIYALIDVSEESNII